MDDKLTLRLLEAVSVLADHYRIVRDDEPAERTIPASSYATVAELRSVQDALRAAWRYREELERDSGHSPEKMR